MPSRNAYIGRAVQVGDQKAGDVRYLSGSAPFGWVRADGTQRLFTAQNPQLMKSMGIWTLAGRTSDADAAAAVSIYGIRRVGNDLFIGSSLGGTFGVYKKANISGASVLQVSLATLGFTGFDSYLGEANGYHFCKVASGSTVAIFRSPQNNPTGTWTNVAQGTTGFPVDVRAIYWCASSSLYVALASTSGVMTSSTGATLASWTQRYTPANSGAHIQDLVDLGGGVLYGFNPQQMWAKSTDGGLTWTTRTPSINLGNLNVFSPLGTLEHTETTYYEAATGKFWRATFNSADNSVYIQSITAPEGASSAWVNEQVFPGVAVNTLSSPGAVVVTPSGYMLFVFLYGVFWRKPTGEWGTTGALADPIDGYTVSTQKSSAMIPILTPGNVLWIGRAVGNSGGKPSLFMDLEHEFGVPAIPDLLGKQAYVRSKV